MKIVHLNNHPDLQEALLQVICKHIDIHDLSLEEIIGTLEIVKHLVIKTNTD